MAESGKRVDRSMVRRALCLIALFLAAGAALVFVLFRLQILDYSFYRQKVLEQMTYETEVLPERGIIYDRNGNILASNTTVYLIFISPQDIIDAMAEARAAETDAEAKTSYRTAYAWTSGGGVVYDGIRMNELIARALSEILGVEYDAVMEKAAKVGRRYEVIRQQVDEESADRVRALISEYGLTRQIYLRASTKRYYPYGTLACHVLGFTNSDGDGVYGLEAYYNTVLKGVAGRYIKAQDAHNQDMPFDYESFVGSVNGSNIVTTLDVYIQYELENQLKATYYESGAANRVTGIVMDVTTGGILAMATYPAFDPNSPYTLDEDSQRILNAYDPESDAYKEKYSELLYTMWKNKATTELYEPGSTFKIITASMGLEEKAVGVYENFTCTGSLTVQGWPRPISCHKTIGHGTLPFYQMLQQSCNPTLMQLALRLGSDVFYRYFLSYGYAGVTGIDLPGESYPIVSSLAELRTVSLAVYSFGQTFKVTPIRQITSVSAVANGGYLMTPHLMREITDGGGNVLQSYETEAVRQVVSKETCDTLAWILEDGVSGNGGAKNAYVKGYKVAAKTGTSEKKDKTDAYGEYTLRLGSCVAFAPADDPQISAIIVVDEPMKGSVYGSVVAAPYISKLLSFVLPYLGVEAQYTEEEMKKVEISLSDYVGAEITTAKADLNWRGINYTVVGNGDRVTAQVPAGGSSIFKDTGKLILYTGSEEPKNTVTVPDLVGKTASAANRLIVNAGLNVSVTGAQNGDTATVISQYPAAGTVVPLAEVVTIELRHLGLTDD